MAVRTGAGWLGSTLPVLGLLTLTLHLAGCGAGSAGFADADPDGFRACEHFERSGALAGAERGEALYAAARRGTTAATLQLRGAVDGRDGGLRGVPVIRDHHAFRTACSGAGYEF